MSNIYNFSKNGITLVPRALSKETCQLIANYAHFKSQTKPNILFGRDELSGVHREYGDPMIESLIANLQPKVEQASCLKLWPSLSFYYYYGNGTKLVKHKDRGSCEIVAGISLGCDEEYRSSNLSWPLKFSINNQEIAPEVDFGDMLIFRGSELEHWREEFAGKWFVSMILGFVQVDGRFAHLKYDQRKKLGDRHIGMFKWSLRNFWYKSQIKK